MRRDHQRIPQAQRASRRYRLVIPWISPTRKMSHRRCLLRLLFVLVCFSVFSSIYFGSLVSPNVSIGRIARISGGYVMEKQQRNNSSQQATIPGKHALIGDIARYLDFGSLFAIKPVNETKGVKLHRDLYTAQLEQGKKNAMKDDAAFYKNLPLGIICPELEIPDLIRNKTPDLRDLAMNESEKFIFHEQLDQLENVVLKGNSEMQAIIGKARIYNMTVRVPIMESLSPLAIKVGNYSYLPGGHWKPLTCLPRWKVAIIIPFRNRSYHLPIVLKYLTPMLQRQRLEFAFYVVNQENNLAFNRAMLMNVGFLEALNFSRWDCFIFHDVDHIPLSDYNYYGCSGMPRHFVSGADRWKFKLLYNSFFGAVTGFTTGNIRQINGFPNVYWGWGGEDDEIRERVKEVGLPISRPLGSTGHFNVIKHHHKSAPAVRDRFNLIKTFKPRFRHDGLSNLKYKAPHVELHTLYTNISVDIQKVDISASLMPQKTAPKPPRQPRRRVRAGKPAKETDAKNKIGAE